MNTHEEYVIYAQAKALKALGFDWPCRCYVNDEGVADGQYCIAPMYRYLRNSEAGFIGDENYATAPTQAVVCRWFREEKGIIVCIEYIPKTQEWTVDLHRVSDNKWLYRVCIKPTYETALSAGIDRALELLKGGEK